jgi:hypothetical protein
MSSLNKIKSNPCKFLIPLLIISILLTVLTFTALADLKQHDSNIRELLWNEGGVATIGSDELLTLGALKKYARAGVWGAECKSAVVADDRLPVSEINDLSTLYSRGCGAASAFYQKASEYGKIVDARMNNNRTGGLKLDNAMKRFSNLSNEIFSIMIGFGLLTSILVFTIIFMRIAWMPAHAIEKRKIMIDIATSGASVMLLGNIWLVISLFQSTFNRFWQTYAVYSKDWRTVANMVLAEYKTFIVGLSGIATLLVLAMFVINFAGLALAGGNTQSRSSKMQSLVYCGLAAAGLGSITILVGFFWNLFA